MSDVRASSLENLVFLAVRHTVDRNLVVMATNSQPLSIRTKLQVFNPLFVLLLHMNKLPVAGLEDFKASVLHTYGNHISFLGDIDRSALILISQSLPVGIHWHFFACFIDR